MSSELARYSDILDNIERINRHVAGLDKDGFVASELVVDAVERCLIRIGEAARKLVDEGLEPEPTSPMHKARGLRNRLSHEYDGISLTTIWEVVTVSLPVLAEYCRLRLRTLGF